MHRIISFLIVVYLWAFASLSFAAFEQSYKGAYNFKHVNDVKMISKSNSENSKSISYSLDSRFMNSPSLKDSCIDEYSHSSFLLASLYNDLDISNYENKYFRSVSLSGQDRIPNQQLYLEDKNITSTYHDFRNFFFNTSESSFNFNTKSSQKVTSTAPIPAAALILGFGLISIVGFIRYKKR